MKYHEAYLLPIGDLHIGDKNFDKSLFETDKYVYIKTHDNKEDGSDDFTRIPIGMVKKIRRV